MDLPAIVRCQRRGQRRRHGTYSTHLFISMCVFYTFILHLSTCHISEQEFINVFHYKIICGTYVYIYIYIYIYIVKQLLLIICRL